MAELTHERLIRERTLATQLRLAQAAKTETPVEETQKPKTPRRRSTRKETR